MRRLLVVLLIVLSFLFTGCFELLEEIWINSDGSGRMRVDFGIPEAMLSMGGEEGMDDPFADIEQKFQETKASVEKNPKVKRIDLTQQSDGTLKHIVLDIEVTDYSELQDLPKLLYAEDDTAKSSQETALEKSELRITKENDGKIIVSRYFGGVRSKESSAPEDTASDPFAQMGEAMAGAMFGNNHYTVKVYADNIVSSTGKLSDDKKTAEWKIPIGSLIMGTMKQKEFRAEILPPSSNMMMYIIGGVLLLGILIGLVASMKKKTNRQMPSPPPSIQG